MAEPQPTIPDDELVKRLSGHVRQSLDGDLPAPVPKPARIATGVLWFLLFFAGLGLTWATLVFPLLYFLDSVLLAILRNVGLIEDAYRRGEEIPIALTMNDLLFTIVLLGSFGFLAVFLIRRASRPPTLDEDQHNVHASGIMGFWGWVRLATSILTYLPRLGLDCLFGAPSDPSAEEYLLRNARMALVIDSAPDPLSLEKVLEACRARFPGAWSGADDAEKATLLRHLRELDELKLVRVQRFAPDRMADRSRYSGTEKLRRLIDRCRIPVRTGEPGETLPVVPVPLAPPGTAGAEAPGRDPPAPANHPSPAREDPPTP